MDFDVNMFKVRYIYLPQGIKLWLINAHNFWEHWPEHWKKYSDNISSLLPPYVMEDVNYVKRGKSINNNKQ